MTDRATLPPPPEGHLILADGGLETELIFHHGIDLPEFAAFDLLKSDEGTAAIRAYYEPFLAVAASYGHGFALDAPTWRASSDWGEKLGYSAADLDAANRAAIALLEELRDEHRESIDPIVIGGCIGPRGDGYAPDSLMSADEAESYHREQIATFADTAAQLVSALTITYTDEAIGIARAAKAEGMPAVISFTVETDGRLPSGETLAGAIEQTDAATDAYPAHYMINCAHPTHFAAVLAEPGPWERIGGLRANASALSHAELDEAENLDDGDPEDLGARYRELRELLPNLSVIGGCCGTNERHSAAICAALAG